MGEFIRSYDWSATSLGTPDHWPQSLRTTLSIILNSKFPMFLFWGPEHLCFYNDAYRPSLGNDGKHPTSLGRPGAEVWPEIWPFIKPLIDQVFSGGDATWNEDQLLPIYRNGQIEDVYWTFSYSPVREESGVIGGVFVTCNETTEKVISAAKLKDSIERMNFAIDGSRLGTWELDPATHIFKANRRLLEWFGLPVDKDPTYKDVISAIYEEDRKKVTEAIARAMDYGTGGRYEMEHRLLHPVTKEIRIVMARGQTRFDNEQKPYRFNGTLQDITEEKRVRNALEQSERRFQNLVREASVGIIVLTGEQMKVTIVNETYGRLIGRSVAELNGQNLFDIIPETEDFFRPVIDSVRKSGEPIYLYSTPYFVWTDGKRKEGYLNLIYQPYKEEDGSITGVMVLCQDVTEQELAKQKI